MKALQWKQVLGLFSAYNHAEKTVMQVKNQELTTRRCMQMRRNKNRHFEGGMVNDLVLW